MSETKLREQLCIFAKSLFDRGLTAGSSGNISLRLDDGGWLMTPTNASLGFLDPARLSRLDGQGNLLGGDAPSKEIALHQALYETRVFSRGRRSMIWWPASGSTCRPGIMTRRDLRHFAVLTYCRH